MTRKREASESGTYHAMIRGVAQQCIFFDAADNRRYLSYLKKYIEEYEVKIFAWCLMSNHVHLLARAENLETLGCMMRDVSGSYAKYINKRYDRVGHLLQGRFLSKPIDTEEHFLTVLRYIHQNPIGPRLSKTCDYRWSSFQEYSGKFEPIITTTMPAIETLGGLNAFMAFHAELGALDESLDPTGRIGRPTPEEAQTIARSILDEEVLSRLQERNHPMRRVVVQTLRDEGLSHRQIADATGIPPGSISTLLRGPKHSSDPGSNE